MYGRNFHIPTALHFAKSSPRKLSATVLWYLCTIFTLAHKLFYWNTLRRWQTGMERQPLRSQGMQGHSVTRVRCNELVSIVLEGCRMSVDVNWRYLQLLLSLFMVLILLSLFPLANGPILPENEIWNVIIQLTCGLRAIHQANLSCRFDKIRNGIFFVC